jgi:hypothetical protein
MEKSSEQLEARIAELEAKVNVLEQRIVQMSTGGSATGAGAIGVGSIGAGGMGRLMVAHGEPVMVYGGGGGGASLDGSTKAK